MPCLPVPKAGLPVHARRSMLGASSPTPPLKGHSRSLAHRGVLFIDELPELPGRVYSVGAGASRNAMRLQRHRPLRGSQLGGVVRQWLFGTVGAWSASSSRMATTRSVLRPSGIVSPGRQFGTAVPNVDGSAGLACASSSLKVKPVIRSSHRCRLGPNGAVSVSQPPLDSRDPRLRRLR
jgi:hypothetical protein